MGSRFTGPTPTGGASTTRAGAGRPGAGKGELCADNASLQRQMWLSCWNATHFITSEPSSLGPSISATGILVEIRAIFIARRSARPDHGSICALISDAQGSAASTRASRLKEKFVWGTSLDTEYPARSLAQGCAVVPGRSGQRRDVQERGSSSCRSDCSLAHAHFPNGALFHHSSGLQSRGLNPRCSRICACRAGYPDDTGDL